MMSRRDTLTQTLLENLPEQDRIPIARARMTWWMNPRAQGGFRLTRQGYDVLVKNLDIKHWCFDITDSNLRMMVELDRKLTDPYFVDSKKKQLVMFGSREAMMALLHGDVKRYLSLVPERADSR